MNAKTLFIVNPNSANGRTGRRWNFIEGEIRRNYQDEIDVEFTGYSKHAVRISRERASGYEMIVVVGGDGTINEVVNGIFADDELINPNLILGVVPYATGSDFVRSIDIPSSVDQAANLLKTGRVMELDVGRVKCLNFEGGEITHYFLNEAEFGMGSMVVDRVNRTTKLFGGKISFLLGILSTLNDYENQLIKFQLDDGDPREQIINNMWIANGGYSGGGINSAPRAILDDGLLDVVCIGDLSLIEKYLNLPKLRNGTFIEVEKVSYYKCKRIKAASPERVLVETDGELIGQLPAEIEILQRRLRVMTNL
ncbi:MAG: diacylglycerol/lipid kinase family protein [Fidelibacterota bacterium]